MNVVSVWQNLFFNGVIGQLEEILNWDHRLRHLS